VEHDWLQQGWRNICLKKMWYPKVISAKKFSYSRLSFQIYKMIYFIFVYYSGYDPCFARVNGLVFDKIVLTICITYGGRWLASLRLCLDIKGKKVRGNIVKGMKVKRKWMKSEMIVLVVCYEWKWWESEMKERYVNKKMTKLPSNKNKMW